MPRPLRYLRRGRVVEIAAFEPRTTLLDHLRLDERATGTKEGCNEGDCGACTVLLGRVEGGRLLYRPVNACILTLGQADGADVVTVDDLADGEALHPVQAAMVAHHGSQCGFCTPGIVTSLTALYLEGERPVTRQAVLDQLAGNLCRCTGYRPIVDAALDACATEPACAITARRAATEAGLAALADDADLFAGDETRFFAAPASLEAASDLLARFPDAVILAGATDVGLWITKQLRDMPRILWLGRIAALKRIEDRSDRVVLGAMVTHADAHAALAGIDPDLGEIVRRFGSAQVRASGTVGGNIANGSPIGDLAPALIALGAEIELRLGTAVRRLPLEAFFLAYGRQDRAPGELLSALDVPKLRLDQRYRAYKLSKRFDEDISAVMAAFRLTLDGAAIVDARIAFGGMAATPKRATGTEAALAGARLDDPSTWLAAFAALDADFAPISDMRASAAYRREGARALLRRALTEIAGVDSRATRLVGVRPESIAAE